jgi:hypothetical protein
MIVIGHGNTATDTSITPTPKQPDADRFVVLLLEIGRVRMVVKIGRILPTKYHSDNVKLLSQAGVADGKPAGVV